MVAASSSDRFFCQAALDLQYVLGRLEHPVGTEADGIDAQQHWALGKLREIR